MNFMNIYLKKWQMSILLIMFLFSLSTSFFLLCDINKPQHYNLLFILPLVFSISIAMCIKIFRIFLDNIGTTILIVLFFCRLVIAPFFLLLSNYTEKIILNVDRYTPLAIVLILYETILIMMSLLVLIKKRPYTEENNKLKSFKLNRRYINILIILTFVQISIFLYTPGLLDGYRTIFNIGDQTFTNIEQSQIINKYATSFMAKLSLVTGSYLMNILRLAIPTVLIIYINKRKKSKIRLFFSYISALIPIFFIDGAIAKSLIYVVVLLLIIKDIYPHMGIKQIAKILAIAAIAVILFWIMRFNYSNNANIYEYFSIRFTTYFSGVNIVSGSFNLPRDIGMRLHYFLYDFLKAIPFGNTLFGLDSRDDIQIYFNLINGTMGYIPTTIGSGYYYFGILLSPIYSVIFSIMAYIMGEKSNNTVSLIAKSRYLFLAITFAMGVVMYNIPITLIKVFSIGIPLYLIEKIGYEKLKLPTINK